MQITVIGQGYVGLPLAITAAESGVVVFGLDSNKGLINDLSKGVSPLSDISSEVIVKNLDSKNYKPTTDVSVITESEIILICVPTPITVERTPDLSFLIKAISSNTKNIALVIPEGCAHGFQVLEEGSELLYLHTAPYTPSSEAAIRFDDPLIGISWPITPTEISQRDLSHPYINQDFKGISI
jgi:hypothetical protein